MFKGSIVAIVTPFKNGVVDEEKLRELVEFHVKNGTSGIVPCGTTGESPTLSHEEHDRVVQVAVEAANKRIPVIAGTGSYNTEETVRMTVHAKKVGADGALLVTPYYNKPTQEGLYRHFEKIAMEVDIPLVIYIIPGRTGVNVLPATVARLAKIDNVVGIKEASTSLDQVSEIISLCGDRLSILSGDDSLTLPIMAVGGRGVISVAANIIPKDVADMAGAFLAGDMEKARKLHYRMYPLFKALFIETNPIPVKRAMELMGLCRGDLRLPLWPMSDENTSKLKKAMTDYGLLKSAAVR